MSYKVFQWASGTVGKHAARVALARHSLDLVGLHVMSKSKYDKDVGEVIGGSSTGVKTTHSMAAVIDSEADVVIHAPLASMVYADNPEQDLDDICALLAAGKNVITLLAICIPKYTLLKLFSASKTLVSVGPVPFTPPDSIRAGWVI